MVAAFAVLPGFWLSREAKFYPVRDSKKLTPVQRESWYLYFKNHPDIFYATAKVSSKVIDRINISAAANLAASRALSKICKLINPKLIDSVLLDGGLMVSNKKLKSQFPDLKTIIKGDEKYNCIKFASIIAKVKRDYLMVKQHRNYPVYGFDEHKGYGTKRHAAAVRKYGPSPIHRLTFLKKLNSI